MAKTKQLQARAPEALKDAFARAAAKLNKTESTLLLELVSEFLDNAGKLPQKAKRPPLRSGVIATRINKDEARALSQVLKAEDKNRSEFLLGLIRARLNKKPHFSVTELNNLREANRQLLAIGRNLNQMVKAIHAGTADSKHFSARYANDLKKYIARQAKAISALIKRNKERDCKGAGRAINFLKTK